MGEYNIFIFNWLARSSGHILTNGFLRDQKIAAKSLLKIDQFENAF